MIYWITLKTMHKMNQEEKRNKTLRLSDASTVDMDFSSDEDLDCFQPDYTLYSDFDVKNLFEEPKSNWEEEYSTLNQKLEEIFAQLELEIEPVNIRDYKSLSSNSVNLNTVLNSKLCRRRATMPPKSTNNL